MRRLATFVVLACMFAGVLAASAAGKLRSFTILAIDTSQTNAGGTQALFQAKKKIGHDSYYCTSGSGGAACQVTFYFKRGQIDAGGAPTSAKNFTWKITRGFGIYRGAKGMLKVHDFTPHRQRVTFDFS